MLDMTPIRVADLDEATRKKIEGLTAAIAAARDKALRESTEDLLLEREAKRRGVRAGDLLYKEVVLKTTRPSEQDVAAEIAAHPEKYKSGKEDSEWAAGTLLDRRLAAREKEFIGGLEKRFAVKAGSNAHVDVAVADVRIRAMKDQQAAVDRVIHDNLLGAEAARRGITPAELTQTEVAAKIAPPTDAELKAEWEKWKKFYGDDFEKARAEVTASVAEAKKTARESAFDSELRAGHSIRLLFEIPSRPALTIDVTRAPAEGPKDAPVTLVEWGDFECPPCGAMSTVVDEALKPYAGRVRYVFLQSPLSMHPHAWKAAEAALAAHAQGKFFPYARTLFANQKALDVASLKKYASDIGLDRSKFDKDLDSGRFAGEVLTQRRLGVRAGVLGTPMFFINGVRGGDDVYSLEGMRAALEAAGKAQW